MNVIPIFIDDWFSSQKISDMDADEERGYFRLLCHAAKFEEKGLPNDPRVLSNWSMLGRQWDKHTKDARFRSSLTSGEKLLACFDLREGRLFNERVDKCVAEYRRRKGQAQKAANARWDRESDANAVPEHMQEHCISNATRVGSGSINTLSLTTTAEKPKKQELLEKQQFWFSQFWGKYWRRVGKEPAWKAFVAIVTAEELFQQIIAALDAQMGVMMSREVEHRPHAATWLRQRRWTDDVASSPVVPIRKERVIDRILREEMEKNASVC